MHVQMRCISPFTLGSASEVSRIFLYANDISEAEPLFLVSISVHALILRILEEIDEKNPHDAAVFGLHYPAP